jgi:Zn-dependent peptidase ImmA (M78 family)
MVRSVLEEEEIAFPLPFIGRMSINSGVGPVLASLQEVLGIDRTEFRAQGTPQAAFAYLRTMAEKSGVFVLLIGNLGSHHTNLDVSAFRGFALADAVAPFVVINDQDARPAWSFTLLHELVHLWVGASGVSGAFGESALEQFCNEVASEFLVPAAELQDLRVDEGIPHVQQDELITRFANDRLVSRSMVAYRLFRAGSISRANWDELATGFREQWQRHRAEERDNNRDRQGGPNYYVVRRHKLGAALLKLVDRSMAEGMLSPTKAGKVLGVKARNVTPLLSAVHGQVA